MANEDGVFLLVGYVLIRRRRKGGGPAEPSGDAPDSRPGPVGDAPRA